MLDRQRVYSTGITAAAAATVALVLWLEPWTSGSLTHPGPGGTLPGVPVSGHRGPAVDIVFAVDTTGSMGGLLDGAKRTVWSIANQVRDLEKDADLRVGLVAYRDEGDAYVTRPFALTDDLDAMYAELASYQAAGGGDEPENVDAALHVAVHDMNWRGDARKIVFLVGDAPPASRGEVPRYDDTARVAARRQIRINTIAAGQDRDMQAAWRQIASAGTGEFSAIQQDGGVQQIATPYDDRMAELAAELDATTVIYGDDRAREAHGSALAASAAAPAAARADRGVYYARKAARSEGASGDVVGAVAAGAMDVASLDHDKLPAELRGRSRDELARDLAARAKRREEARKQITALARQRDEYLEANAADARGFDAVVKRTLGAQLK